MEKLLSLWILRRQRVATSSFRIVAFCRFFRPSFILKAEMLLRLKLANNITYERYESHISKQNLS